MACSEIYGGCNEDNTVDCGCKFFVESFSCIKYDGVDLPCINIKKGDNLEDAFIKIDSLICGVTSGEDGLSAYEVAVSEGFEGTVEEWLISLQGTNGTNGTDGADGVPGVNGENGLTGRGVAVFTQVTEPNQTDFDNEYGTIDGFGVNSVPGSETFKPGDIWIEPCNT